MMGSIRFVGDSTVIDGECPYMCKEDDPPLENNPDPSGTPKMLEQIEKDRVAIRTGIPSIGFSYLPYLCKRAEEKKKSLKVHGLSTLNLLCYIEESFKQGDRQVLKKLNKIKEELMLRKDLFQSVLLFLQNKKVRDDLYYWSPGLAVDNIFSFITEIVPNFIREYKNYFIEAVITKKNYLDVSEFIQERFRTEYEQFYIMNKDLQIFKECISLSFWTDVAGIQEIQSTAQTLGLRERIDINEDVEGILVPDLSFADVTINGKRVIASLSALNGLFLKIDAFKAFWKDKGVIDDSWNII